MFYASASHAWSLTVALHMFPYATSILDYKWAHQEALCKGVFVVFYVSHIKHTWHSSLLLQLKKMCHKRKKSTAKWHEKH